jgi:ankyrin repeat protein
MGWPSRLSYKQVVVIGIARSLVVLVSYGDFETASAILAADPSLAEDPEALAAAARVGHEPLVRAILQHRPGVVKRVAVAAKSRALTELLFQSGMNPNLAGWLGVTPLHRFAREGDAESAAVFLDHGANLHARDEEFCTTPLGYAAAAGKRRMVEFLLERGAKVTLPDDLDWATPIALATYRGHRAIVSVLKAHNQSLARAKTDDGCC